MITHTDYINKMNTLIKNQSDAVTYEIDLKKNGAPASEVSDANDAVYNVWMEITSLMAMKVDPATKRKVAMSEDHFFVFVDDIS